MEEATTLPQRKTAKTSSDLETKSTSTATTTTATREDTPKLARGGTHERGRPFIRTFQTSDQTGKTLLDVQLPGREEVVPALYDTGADITCISEEEFRRIPIRSRPNRNPTLAGQSFRGAGGGHLEVRGIYNMPLKILNQDLTHPVHVICNLREVSPHLLPNTQRNLLAW